jgi:integrase
MPKLVIQALSDPTVKSAGPGRYADGGGLYLLVKPDGARSWLLRYQGANGKRRDMGLGRAPGRKHDPKAVTLAQARERAGQVQDELKAGVDPLTERGRKAAEAKAAAQAARISAITFRDVAATYLAAHEGSWRNPKHRQQWSNTLAAYAYPHFGDVAVADVATAHVMASLEPIWREKPETASRVRGRIETVLDYAKAREWRVGDNPARWRGHVENMLPARDKVAKVEHHAALLWAEIGAFMAGLKDRPATAARALQFAILTAARTGEVLGATWAEIDRKAGVWAIAGERMKAGRPHRVPLSAAALAILDEMEMVRPSNDKAGAAPIFPGANGGPLSNMAMTMMLRRMKRADLTVHGFRSSFRDWAEECTSYSRAVVEKSLAHAIGDKVEAAYRRGDLLDKRRRLMADWAAYCERPSATAANVQPIRAGS